MINGIIQKTILIKEALFLPHPHIFLRRKEEKKIS